MPCLRTCTSLSGEVCVNKRFLMQRTVKDRILHLHSKKMAIVQGVFGGHVRREGQHVTVGCASRTSSSCSQACSASLVVVYTVSLTSTARRKFTQVSARLCGAASYVNRPPWVSRKYCLVHCPHLQVLGTSIKMIVGVNVYF